jgi:putative flippase GtrA
MRYVVVSAINVFNHQALLLVAHGVWDWSGGIANVFAAVVAAIPAYLLSRYWVWSVRGAHSVRAEIIPFWTLALLGLVVSTVLAETADRLFESSLAVSAASFAGYLVVWVVKFLVLNRIFERSAARLTREELGVR